MKKLFIFLLPFLLVGCFHFREKPSPNMDYMQAIMRSQKNVDSDSNDSLDILYGGLNSPLTDPDADKLLFWDDGEALGSNFAFLSLSTGLLLDGTDLKVSAILQEYHAVDPSAFALTIFDDADEATVRATIGAEGDLGTEAGLYSALSDVDEFAETDEAETWTAKQDFQKSFTTLTGPAVWNCWARTGGATGALDAIPIADLTNGDIAIVLDSSYGLSVYRFNSTATDAESDPDYIRPDDYSSAGVWYLTSSITNMKADDPYISLREKDGTTWYIGVDDTGNSIELRTNSAVGNSVMLELDESGNVHATGAITGAIKNTTQAGAYNINSSDAKLLYGGLIIHTGNQQTVTIGTSAAAGMNFCVLADGADASAEVYVDPDAGDHYEYDGTSMDNGEYIYNDSDKKGDRMCFVAIDADTWIVTYGGDTTVAEETP